MAFIRLSGLSLSIICLFMVDVGFIMYVLRLVLYGNIINTQVFTVVL